MVMVFTAAAGRTVADCGIGAMVGVTISSSIDEVRGASRGLTCTSGSSEKGTRVLNNLC